MFIESAQKLPFNTQIEIVIRLPGASQDSRLPAIVRWSDKVGFGVQFGLLGALETHLIAELTRG
jgi:hypothetical protein